MNRWTHWSGRGYVRRRDKVTYTDMHFIYCTKGKVYARRLASTAGGNLSLTDDDPDTHSPGYVAFKDPYDTSHFLASFDYLLKKNMFEQRFHVRTGLKLLFNWYCVDIFGIPTRHQKEMFVQVPCWLSS